MDVCLLYLNSIYMLIKISYDSCMCNEHFSNRQSHLFICCLLHVTFRFVRTRIMNRSYEHEKLQCIECAVFSYILYGYEFPLGRIGKKVLENESGKSSRRVKYVRENQISKQFSKWMRK